MRTLLTIKEQKEFLQANWHLKTIIHQWSSRGYGNSKILDGRDTILAKASGCGYDRYGAALGNFITEVFPKEVYKLAKRECKGKRRTYKKSTKFYGLFFNSVDNKAWLDGGCGDTCMTAILAKIGFKLEFSGEHSLSNNGKQFYTLRPIRG